MTVRTSLTVIGLGLAVGRAGFLAPSAVGAKGAAGRGRAIGQRDRSRKNDEYPGSHEPGRHQGMARGEAMSIR